jgi:hypothetical protein
MRRVRASVVVWMALWLCPGVAPGQTDLKVAPDGSVQLKLDAIANLADFGALNPNHRGLLERQAWFVAGSQARHLVEIYERNDYLRLPSYITVDLLIDLARTVLAFAQRVLEEKVLHPRLLGLSTALVKEADRVRSDSQNEAIQKAATEILTFWAVAARLLDDKAEVPADVAGSVDQACKAIEGGKGRSALAGAPAEIDLADFRPPARSVRGEILKKTFRALTWLAKVAWRLRGGDARPLHAALHLFVLKRALVKDEPALDELNRLSAAWTAFVGKPDAATPRDLVRAFGQAYGEISGADALGTEASLSAFAALVSKLEPPRMVQAEKGEGTAPVPQLRLLGARAFGDAAFLRQVAFRAERPFPMGLDVAVALESERALELLRKYDPQVSEWVGFGPALIQGKTDLEDFAGVRYGEDGYHGLLQALRELFRPVDQANFPALRTPSWPQRLIHTATAAWALARHEPVLDGAASSTGECVSPAGEAPPGAVEPYVDVYRRLREMTERLRRGIEGLRAGAVVGPRLEALIDALRLCERLAEKELAGKPLDAGERHAIATFWGRVASLAAERDQELARVSEIGTHEGKPFFAAVGRPDELYLVVRVDGKLTLMRGATFSFYELQGKKGEVLTDAAWRQRLSKMDDSERPVWFSGLVAPGKKPPPASRPARVSCPHPGAAHGRF